MKTRVCLFSTAFLILAPLGWADESAKSEKLSRTEQVEALTKEYTDAMATFRAWSTERSNKLKADGKAFADLSPAEQTAYRAESNKMMPNRATFGNKFVKIIEENPADEAAFGAAKWIFTNVALGKPMQEAGKALIAHHLENKEIGELCTMLAYFPFDGTEELLNGILEKNPSKDAQGAALYSLGTYQRRQASMARRYQDPSNAAQMAGLTSFYGKEYVDKLKNANPDELEKTALAHFERAVKEFADAKLREQTVGELAGAVLFEIEHLSIGKHVPEIEGEDTDGVPFKLSDYKGKVVVLDFWGHW